MTAAVDPPDQSNRRIVAQVEGPPVGAVIALPVEHLVPAHLLDGGEIVILAIKPSLWFVPLTSARWLILSVVLFAAANISWLSPHVAGYLRLIGYLGCAGRLGWAMLQWVSRLYVLTNRRVMRLRGVFNVELFQCELTRVQSVVLSASLPERLVRSGTILIQTAGALGSASGTAAWRIVARPLEVHQKLSEAIRRAGNRGSHELP